MTCQKIDPICSPFTTSGQTNENNLHNSIVDEHLNIGGATINIYKLLGIHEQEKLMPINLNGSSISSGDFKAFPSNNVFLNNGQEWRSTFTLDNISKSWIGYDFGPIKLDNGRLRYSIDTGVRHEINTIMLQQGCDPNTRATKLRVERSDDANTWYGVDIIKPENNNEEQVFNIKPSAPARYWRLVALEYTGQSNTDFWTVRKIQFSEYTSTNINNIQDDFGILENRDRHYSNVPISIKGYYEIQEIQTELSRFGIDVTNNQWVFKIAFNTSSAALGRPIVIGDIFEIPSEVQYNVNMQPVKKYLEVTDVSWATDGFLIGWKPTIQKVIAMPMLASQETIDIIGGDLNLPTNINDYFGMDNKPFNIESLHLNEVIHETAAIERPEMGADNADIAQLPDEIIDKDQRVRYGLQKLNKKQWDYGHEDAMPPNGLPYTEGEKFPESPKDGDYHRLTYAPVGYDQIPTRLYKYSIKKLRWIFMEEDKRMLMNKGKYTLDSLLNDKNSGSATDIGK